MLLPVAQESTPSERGKDYEQNRDLESAMADAEPESSVEESDENPVPTHPCTRGQG